MSDSAGKRRGVHKHLYCQRDTVRMTILSVIFSAWLVAAPQQGDDAFKIITDSNLVLLDVGVKDTAGRYVSNLTKDNFRIFDDSKQQVISQFGAEDAPVTVGLVIDNSGSMRPKQADVITAALVFLGASNPKDEVFVTHFNEHVRTGLPADVPFTGDIQLLRASLFKTPEGKTALYDAIVFSLHHLNKGTQDKKSLLLISDGGDNASLARLPDVVNAVRESRATIYTIGIYDEDDVDRNPGLLRRLASISGGEAFFPKQLTELSTICRQIAKDIRNRYTVGYVPDNLQGQPPIHKIRVTATADGQKNLVVRARTSYQLPGQTQAQTKPK
jgi:Ca-activated chloride channel family protein